MKFATFAPLLFALPVFAARIPIKTPPGPVKPDSYIVVLKASVNKDSHLDGLAKITTQNHDSISEITNHYEHVLHGYSAILTGASLEHVLTSSDVDFVEANGIASINYEDTEIRGLPIDLAAREPEIEARAAGGAGVVIYGIDTGIYTAHTSFAGRASWGATFGGYGNADGNGHGTHTAATAVGNVYGVATAATIVAVKVLGDNGKGSISDVISGVQWSYTQFINSKKPSIATLSLSGGISPALDTAVTNAIAGGLHVTVAAGNNGKDASNYSPAHVATANTIGAIDSNNVIAYFSNWGKPVTVFAPGVNILSAWIGNPTATNTISGTSMATPFVAGILAIAIGEYGQVTPASLKLSLQSHAQPVVTGQPQGTTNLKATLW